MRSLLFAEKNDSGLEQSSLRILLLAMMALLLYPLSASAQCVTSWKGGAAGNWSVTANWTAGVPSNNNACISTANSAVTLNIAGATAANLTLGMNTDSLFFNNGTSLTVSGSTISNAGTISLNSAGNFTELVIGAPNVTLSGGGTLTMSNNVNNYILGSLTTDTLTNQETIQGAGHIGNGQMTLVNSGIINANQSAGLTIQADGGATNTGTIEATGGTLLLFGTTIANAGGKISDAGNTLQVSSSTINGGMVTLTGAATLQLNNGTIHGGSTLTNSATGTIEVTGSGNTLGGTVVNPAGGVIKIDNGGALTLENGSYPNLGSVTLNSTANFTELVVGGANVTLSGGSVTMSNNVNNYIFGSLTTDTLTNQETIQGAGHIGNGQMTLVSSGIINANQSAGLTIQANGGFTNPGTLIVGAGDVMHVFGGPFSNFSGSTLTGGTYNVTGTLQIDQLGSTGGEILTNAASIILNGTTSSLIDSLGKDAIAKLNTNAAGGSFTIAG